MWQLIWEVSSYPQAITSHSIPFSMPKETAKAIGPKHLSILKISL
jgi:hypothetical protein